MKKEPGRSAYVPRCKRAIARQLSDEFLVYEEETNRAHCLNQTAAEVWKLCDGKRTIAQIVHTMEKQSRSPVDEQIVWMALTSFAKAGLLLNWMELSSEAGTMSRREAVRRVGAVAAGFALPVVTSILVPTPAEAVSCFHGGHACTSNGQCCSGLCAPLLHTCVGG